MSKPIQERFDERWTPEPFSGCWLWTGDTDNKGYGRIKHRYKDYLAHRLSWELYRGKPNLFVLHKCDTPLCVNPDHLFLGTQADNLRDASQKGRLKRKQL